MALDTYNPKYFIFTIMLAIKYVTAIGLDVQLNLEILLKQQILVILTRLIRLRFIVIGHPIIIQQ